MICVYSAELVTKTAVSYFKEILMGDKVKASFRVGEIIQKDGEWVKVVSVINHPEHGKLYRLEAATEEDLRNNPPKK